MTVASGTSTSIPYTVNKSATCIRSSGTSCTSGSTSSPGGWSTNWIGCVRIHVLEGFEKVFDALDEIIRIIRKSDGKADSAEKIMKRFDCAAGDQVA